MRRQIILGLSGTLTMICLAYVADSVHQHDAGAALAWLLPAVAWIALGVREARR